MKGIAPDEHEHIRFISAAESGCELVVGRHCNMSLNSFLIRRWLGRQGRSHVIWLLLFVTSATGEQRLFGAADCPALSDVASKRASSFVEKRYDIKNGLHIEDEGTVGAGCFRRLVFTGVSPKRRAVLFMSPDQRYLVPDLQDIFGSVGDYATLSPLAAAMKLTGDKSPERGYETAGVTIVVFSDFECPFCKELESLIAGLNGSSGEKNVRVVYKQRPLPSHEWAREAALASICASYQGNSAFWRVHDLLFSDQQKFTGDNFYQGFLDLLQDDKAINISLLQSCLASEQAEPVLDRDERLAEAFHVTATPTVFINGRRYVGFRTQQELTQAIAESTSCPKPPTSPSRIPYQLMSH